MEETTTLGIIKPDAMRNRYAGKIIDIIENNGLTIVAIKVVAFTKENASNFYSIHEGKPFYTDLITFMSSGRSMILAMKGENAIEKWRTIMGPTNPDEATDGTIRKLFGTAVNRNASHGSDSIENAKREIDFFFKSNELVSVTKQ